MRERALTVLLSDTWGYFVGVGKEFPLSTCAQDTLRYSHVLKTPQIELHLYVVQLVLIGCEVFQ